MIDYTAALHRASRRVAQPPFPQEWEDIGPGYCYSPAFGHWDIVHAMLDQVDSDSAHVLRQIRNDLANQQADGFLPGAIGTRNRAAAGEPPRYWFLVSHPPVWPAAVDAYMQATGDESLLPGCLDAACRQIGWFQAKRRAEPEGFFYTDILNRNWESGVDEGVRFDDAPRQALACMDATSHVLMLMRSASAWAEKLGKPDAGMARQVDDAERLLRESLYCQETGFFHDAWSVNDPPRRRLCMEGFWPMIAGAASAEQANRLIDEHLLNENQFFTAHPLPSLAICEPAFELRMWRGPTWNSMTMWVAWGCLRYGRRDAAAAILGRALDCSSAVFARTGTIWEFYHPHGGEPTALARKPQTQYNTPCRDYLGHNPLWMMARLYAAASAAIDQT
jgi:glycogen debranching enzyme